MNDIDYFSDLQIIYASRVLLLETGVDFMSDPSGSFEFIRSGSVTLEFEDRKLFLQSPAIAWIPPDTKFRFVNDASGFYDHLWINFTGPRANRMLAAFQKNMETGYIRLDEECSKELEIDFMSMVNDFRHDPELYHDRIVLTLEKIVWRLKTFLNPLPVETENDPYQLNKLAQNIALNPFSSYDVPKLAAEKQITGIHFRRLFRKTVGLPIHQYVIQQKIRYCEGLLRSGKFSIKEVAAACGFADLGNFSRFFRKYTGLSPREYQQQPSGCRNR